MNGLAQESDTTLDQGRRTHARKEATLAQAFVDFLAEQGVEHSFGVSGGAIALVFDALVEHQRIALHHFRHETGAAFAATEAHFVTGKPTAVFATTGPGTLNVLTGITAARWDGAKVILISGSTTSPQRGRWATQETSSYTLPQDMLYTQGQIFDFAIRVEHAAEFPEVVHRLRLGLCRPGRFIAHISMPMGIQGKRIDQPSHRPFVTLSPPTVTDQQAAECARLLLKRPFGIWVGFGASGASSLVRELAERTGAKVFCSPRGKGIFSEDHPNFLGVTGLGGHESVNEFMTLQKPGWVLVLGSRLGEPTSCWDLDMVPAKGFMHIDIDPEIPGTAYPEAATLGIHADINCFLTALLRHIPPSPAKMPVVFRRSGVPATLPAPGRRPIRPQVLMQAVQSQIVQNSTALIMAECGNAFAWSNHYLRFTEPNRYRVSMLFGSMGHTAAGVVGAALARGGKAVAIVGDGSMLMNPEISTAVQYQAASVWIVLNDAGYGMCRDGHIALGLTGEHIEIPRVDFVAMARSVGADGVKVESESAIEAALDLALAAPGPFVIDVEIDPSETSPLLRRFEGLIKQGNSKNVAGWES